jgi:hypothetical protein
MTDYGGLALLITAISGATTVALQVVSVLSGNQRDKKLDVIHDLANGQSKALNKITGDAAFSEGRIQGATDEQARHKDL